jgi:hypothetical protein
VGAYISEIRTSKGTFRVSAVLAAAQEISNAALPSKELSTWASVRDIIQSLTRQAVAFLPIAMEADHVVKSKL